MVDQDSRLEVKVPNNDDEQWLIKTYKFNKQKCFFLVQTLNHLDH